MHMRRLGLAVLDFLKDESGPTAVEYAIVTALIVAFCLPTIVNLGSRANNSLNTVSNVIKGTGS
jgi:pilus assembly protein Flp/PilA